MALPVRTQNSEWPLHAAVAAALAKAVNAVLASPQQCPDVPGGEEQAELRRIREIAASSPFRSVPG